MALQEGDKGERRKLKDVESYRALLDTTARRWPSDENRGVVHRLFAFATVLEPLIASSGYRLVVQLQGRNLMDVLDFLTEKGEAWKRNLAEALDRGFSKDQWDDFANLGTCYSFTAPNILL